MYAPIANIAIATAAMALAAAATGLALPSALPSTITHTNTCSWHHNACQVVLKQCLLCYFKALLGGCAMVLFKQGQGKGKVNLPDQCQHIISDDMLALIRQI
jgi:hypothetical protein